MFHNRRQLIAVSRPPFVGGAAEDALVAPWVAAVVSAGGSVSAPRRAIVNTLATGLRSNGLVSVLDRLWLLAAANTQQANIDLINLATWTAVSSPTFTADQGYTADGGSGLNTNFTASAAGGHFTLNSASFGTYILNNRTTSQTAIAFGASDNGNSTALEPKETTPAAVAFINGFSSFYNLTIPSIRHSWVVTRTSANDVAIYQDNVSTPFVVDAANPSSALNTVPFYIFSSNGPGHNMAADVIGAVFIGGGLTATQAVNLSNRINTYIGSIGLTAIW